MKLYKYSGAGNDFVVIDGRGVDVGSYRDVSRIQELCNRQSGFIAADGRVGADGLMILDQCDGADFRMEYYNSDGSSGMMCGNGGRCIVAFAEYLGIKPSGEDTSYVFEAPDGLHTAKVLSRDGDTLTVKLKMVDVNEIVSYSDGCFLDTGTRHFVCFRDDVEAVVIDKEGPTLRYDPRFAPQGANVNFVTALDGAIKLRTFEKGVEAETLACGTGITASAIASCYKGIAPSAKDDTSESVSYSVYARIDRMEVSFVPVYSYEAELVAAREVFLTGPATLVK